MLGMSFEHANQLRQLIVEKCLSQPAETANKVFNNHLFQSVHHHITQNYFLSLASWQPRKIFNFMRQPVPVTLLPLEISSVLARVTKSMTKPVSGTLANSVYCPLTTSGTSSGYLSRVHAVFPSVFSYHRRHQNNTDFRLSPQSYNHF